jgi:hypothetical protein
MSTPLSRLVTRVAYGARQLPRVAWYVGHSLVLRQLSEATRHREGQKARRRPRTNLPVPDRNRIYADMASLFLQDLANVEAGIFRFLPIMMDRRLRYFTARGFSSRTFPPSTNVVRAAIIRKF